MKKNKILLVAFSQFDLLYLTNKIFIEFQKDCVDLICEKKCLEIIPDIKGFRYNVKYIFEDNKKRFLSIKYIHKITKVQKFFLFNQKNYDVIFFGAYRHLYTSLFLRHTSWKENLNTIVQVHPSLENQIPVRKNFRKFIYSMFLRLFGYSDFKYTKIKNQNSPNESYLSDSLLWRIDPFKQENIEVIPDVIRRKQTSEERIFDKRIMSGPSNIKEREKEIKIFIIGERTPVVHYYPSENQTVIKIIFNLIKNSNSTVYLRPRENLTDLSYYSEYLNFVSLDPNQLLHRQLLELQPDFVLSFKSTGLKAAADLGLSSYALYPLLQLDDQIMHHFSMLLDDPRLIKLQTISELEKLFS